MEPKNVVKKYKGDQITIIWKPKMCIHSAKCWKGESGLHSVFKPQTKPWIDPIGAETDRIIQQINMCPSGALSYEWNDQVQPNVEETKEVNSDIIVETITNGPLMVHGCILLKNNAGELLKTSNVTAFCRCGASEKKPYCDGSHRKIDFKE